MPKIPFDESIKGKDIVSRKITIAIPLTDNPPIDFVASYMNLEKPNHYLITTNAVPIDTARNDLVKMFLVQHPDSSHILFWDSIPYNETIFVEIDGVLKKCKIGEYVESFFDSKEPIGKERLDVSHLNHKTFSMRKDGKFVLSPIKYVMRHKVRRKIYRLTLRGGGEIELSEGHYIPTWLPQQKIRKAMVWEDGKVVNKSPEDIDRVITPYSLERDSKDIPYLKIDLEKINENWFLEGEYIKELIQQNYEKFREVQKDRRRRKDCKNLKRNLYLNSAWLKRGKVPLWAIRKLGLKIEGECFLVCNHGSRIPIPLKLDDDLLKFFGLWIADGSFNNGGVVISCPEALPLMQKVCSNFKAKVTLKKNGVDILINSLSLREVMKQLGFNGYSENKRVPSWVFNLPKRQINCFLEGYFLGDGSFSEELGVQSWATVSKELHEDILDLLLLVGKRASSTSFKSGGFAHRRICYRGALYIKRRKRKLLNFPVFLQRVVKKEVVRETEETLYDLGTEEGNFYCSGILVHNSDTIPPSDGLKKLWRWNKPIVSGLYFRKVPPFYPVMSIWNVSMGGLSPVIAWEDGKLIPVDGVGMGFCLIRRDVFQALKPPWFSFNNKWGVCALPGQEVFGSSKIEDIKIGDSVLTGDGSFQTVYNTFSRYYEGEIVEIVPSTIKLPIKVTAEHKILTLQGVERRYPTTSKRFGERRKTIPLPKVLDFLNASEKWIRAGDVKEGMYVAFPIIKERNITELNLADYGLKIFNGRAKLKAKWGKGIPSIIPITKELCELFGFYLAEGCPAGDKQIEFCFGPTERDYAERIKYLLKNIFDVNSWIIEGDHALFVKAKSVPLVFLFKKWFGTHAFNKRIPIWLLQVNEDCLKSLIKGLWLGDGFKTYIGPKKHECLGLNTSSKELALGIVAALIRLKIRPELREYTQPKNAFGHGKKIYHIKVTADAEKLGSIIGINIAKTRKQRTDKSFFFNNKFWFRIKKVSKKYYSGKVYDLTIQPNNSYILENIIVHNSEDFYFCLRVKEELGEKVWVDTSCVCKHASNVLIDKDYFSAFRMKELMRG